MLLASVSAQSFYNLLNLLASVVISFKGPYFTGAIHIMVYIDIYPAVIERIYNSPVFAQPFL